MGSAPYRASAVHFCLATPNAVTLEGGESNTRAFGNALLSIPLPYKPGRVNVPDGPGLGFEFDEKELAKLVVGWGAPFANEYLAGAKPIAIR